MYSDPCPTPPGAAAEGCVASARLARLEASGSVMVGAEQVMVEDWCQQFPGHSIGHLAFGADGALYVSAGDAAHFNFADYGQDGTPLNPCGDPPGGVGGVQTPPTVEGGALRTQDLRTSSGLRSMRERAVRLGGRLDFESSNGHGACVMLTVPLTRTSDSRGSRASG